jgi:RNA polymerase sigma factor (sigma-70 family)
MVQTTADNTTKKRAEQLLAIKIRVFPDKSFDDPKQKNIILADIPGVEKFQKDEEKVQKLRLKNDSPEMRPCYEAPLLSFEQEQHLFRKMNYFKYRAQKLIANINLNKISKKKLENIEDHLAVAALIRNQIAESNFRLGTQLLKGQITFYRENSLVDGLLSDAYFDVLKSVDYFDWRKGFKFSTYATWVLKKNFFRDSKQKILQAEKFGHLDESRAELLNSRGDGHEEERAYSDRKVMVRKLLNLLLEAEKTTDRARQVRVLENYFGVNGNKQTLEQISYDLGVTKERVRQLKEKGLQWIRQKVDELGIELEA